jgi:hypothetical protein
MTTLERFLGHAKLMNDVEIEHDFNDCLLPEARPGRDREILTAYRDARRRASGFHPHRDKVHAFNYNNHRQCGWDAREPGLLGTADKRVCVECGTPLDVLSRDDAQTCSPKCRRRLARRLRAA